MSITVRNAQRKMRVAVADLQNFANSALQLCLRESAPAPSVLHSLGEIAVVLVSDRRSAALHQQFMDIAGPTDVITFAHGEIFISTETARRQAREFGTTPEDEIKLYIVHGLLHLHGFDDQMARDSRRMNSVQARIFAVAKRR